MTKQVERIARKVMGDNAGVMTDGLTRAGTYHGIGADCCGSGPNRSGLRGLIDLAWHEKRFSKTANRFRSKGACLSIYSRCVNA